MARPFCIEDASIWRHDDCGLSEGGAQAHGHGLRAARYAWVTLLNFYSGETVKSIQSFKIAAAVVASSALVMGAVAQTGNNATAAGSSESVGEHLSDGTITTKVKAELLGAKDVRAQDIHVKTQNGVVWLTGSVPSRADKTRAQQVVSGVSGVQMIKNRLKVSVPSSSD
jgi:osmotically-inducible protein OsmY